MVVVVVVVIKSFIEAYISYVLPAANVTPCRISVFADAGVKAVSKLYINTPSSATSKSKLAPVAVLHMLAADAV